ncbi:hypothetical protein [Pseudothioclava nitratireducens]|uniref:hypothetical protein n=1 Tax=Pseudothioclava nitratireducens TaxID=1928646 RepID=UPI0023DB8DF8|nr:hypothetical protein [Defluviimonas nitratireducens]MDF1620542.1 hypothetical protein [Defluviimonas nitratireducens]
MQKNAPHRIAYVHIGPHKCGTTAIQSHLKSIREALLAQGYLYPTSHDDHARLLPVLFWDSAYAPRLGRVEWIETPAGFKNYRQGLMDRLVHEIESCAAPNLVLCAETLSEFTETEASRMTAFLRQHYDEVRVIAYLREPLAWVDSMAQQALKWHGETLDELFDAPRLPHYKHRLCAFQNAVEPSQFEVRPYEGGAAFDVVADFLRTIGIDPSDVGAPQSRANESKSWRSAILLSSANRLAPIFVNYSFNPTRAYRFAEAVNLPGEKFVLPKETISAISSKLEEEREWVASRFGISFARPADTRPGRAEWDRGERPALEDHGAILSGLYRSRQNEGALRNLLALRQDGAMTDEMRAQRLRTGWATATDPWVLHELIQEMRAINHPDLARARARRALLMMIEKPSPGDPPLVYGNPMDRPDLLQDD